MHIQISKFSGRIMKNSENLQQTYKDIEVTLNQDENTFFNLKNAEKFSSPVIPKLSSSSSFKFTKSGNI